MSDPVALLSALVRIPSVNPPGDGEAAVAEALREPLAAAGLHTQILSSPVGRPSLVARLPGPTDRPPLLLLSHTDVVPVEPDAWSRDPFGGEVAGGMVWGRGALDMKATAVMHAEAAAALAASGATPIREVIVAAVADEEAGGSQGAEWLLTAHAPLLGFRDDVLPEVLGEGGVGLAGLFRRPVMPIVVGEKGPLGVRARATGTPGHGSMPPSAQAIRRLVRFVEAVAGHTPARLHPVVADLFAALADATDGPQRRLFRLLASPAGPAAVRVLAPLLRAKAGAIGHLVADSITPTRVAAGYKFNVVPGVAEAAFDCRLLPGTDPREVLAALARAGRRHGVTVEETHRWSSPVSPHGDLFAVLAEVSATLPGTPLPVASLTPGTTDLRFFRARGATAYGWVPLLLTPDVLAGLHGHDERVPVDGFRAGVQAMTQVVRRAAARG